MTLGIPPRDDFDGFALRALAKSTKDAARLGGFLSLPKSMMVIHAATRPGSAA